MGLMTLVSMGLQLLFTLQGFWPILPFAGLELAALGVGAVGQPEAQPVSEVIVHSKAIAYASNAA